MRFYDNEKKFTSLDFGITIALLSPKKKGYFYISFDNKSYKKIKYQFAAMVSNFTLFLQIDM